MTSSCMKCGAPEEIGEIQRVKDKLRAETTLKVLEQKEERKVSGNKEAAWQSEDGSAEPGRADQAWKVWAEGGGIKGNECKLLNQGRFH